MTLPVEIQGTGNASTISRARVTSAGQLVTGNVSFDLTSFVQMAIDDTAYNLFKPRAGRQFIISGILATGDKSIAANASALIEIYEAASDTSTVVAKSLMTFVLTQSTVLPMFPLNILVSEGVFINAKTDDNNVFLTIIGYYIPLVTE